MKDKLMINIEKLKNKSKIFKSNRFKAIIGATAIAATLTSCEPSYTNSTNTNNENTTSYSIQEESIYRPLRFNFENVDDEIKEKEVIGFIDGKDTIYNLMTIPNEETFNSHYDKPGTRLQSTYLGKMIELPETTENERVVINIDYATKQIDISVEPYQNARTR